MKASPMLEDFCFKVSTCAGSYEAYLTTSNCSNVGSWPNIQVLDVVAHNIILFSSFHATVYMYVPQRIAYVR